MTGRSVGCACCSQASTRWASKEVLGAGVQSVKPSRLFRTLVAILLSATLGSVLASQSVAGAANQHGSHAKRTIHHQRTVHHGRAVHHGHAVHDRRDHRSRHGERGKASVLSSSVGVVTVVPSPSTIEATATYTINFSVAGALTAGTGTITIDTIVGAPSTVLPSPASDYKVNDTTTSAGTGTVSVPPTLTSGLATVTFVVPRGIKAGDALSLVVSGVTNPATVSNSDTLSVSTSSDTVPVTSAPYAISASSDQLHPDNRNLLSESERQRTL